MRNWFATLALLAFTLLGEATPQLPFIDGEAKAVKETPALNLEALSAERATILKRLEAAQSTRDPAAVQAGHVPPDAAEELALLNRLSTLLDRILQLAPTLDELSGERAGVGEELAQLRTTGRLTGAPLTFRALDLLRDERELERKRTDSLISSTTAAKSAVSQAEGILETRRRQARDAKTALDGADDAGDESIARRAHALVSLQERIAQMEFQLRQLEFAECDAREQLGESRAQLLTKTIDLASEFTLLGQLELDEVLEELTRETARLENDLAGLRRTLSYSKSRWESAAGRLAEQTAPTELERQDVASLYQHKEADRYRERAFGERLARLAERRLRWGQRLKVTRDELDDEKRTALIAELQTRRSALRLEKTRAQERLAPLRGELRSIELKLEQSAELEGLALQFKNQRRYLSQRISTYELNIASMEALGRLIERMHVDLVGEDGHPLLATWRTFKASFKTIWLYEISVLNETPITVRKLVLGMLILVIGLRMSRRFSLLVANRLLPKLGLEKPAAAVVRTLLFYFLTVTFILVALKFVDVPLTAFTVLGGALAVGIGFGSQNIVNNFISGLIILAEQPIRVGDLVQIGDLFGNVVRIGARSTQVRTGANVEIMVPNSSFLENNVVNLTLSDDKIRAFVEIGVAYGSPVRDVNKLLKLAASEHGRILKSPEPFVLFESFGDNSLLFEVHFWIRARAVMDRRIIESDLRNRIDSVFRSAKIEIAFPQRDVHLDTKTPLRVQVVETVSSEQASG